MIPERLKKARIDRNWSLKELATESGVAYEQISRYESGKNKPNSSVLLKLAEALEVSVQYLKGITNIKYQDLIPGPSDEHFNLVMERVKTLSLTARERRVIVEFLELIITKKDIQQLVIK
jgi:transcriptional regulator with XRE-family HTH domain